jgi:hypothetical protein
MVRVADGTGGPLDTSVFMIASGIREELSVNKFASKSNARALRFFKGLLEVITGRFLWLLY